MKLLIVGDTHGNSNDLQRVFNYACLQEVDRIVQVGDFGYGWERQQFKGGGGLIECAFVRYAGRLAETTGIPFFWLDGNHENHDMLAYAVEGEGTANVHPAIPQEDGTYQMRPGVWYIPRGTLLEWGDKKILVCGGAASVDKAQRRPFISWWPGELITDEDVAKCIAAGPADILLTHDLPLGVSVIDRHLDPIWGQEASDLTYLNRRRITNILDASRAELLVHGHLHRSYTEVIAAAHARVKVIGLDCDGAPMDMHCTILDV